MKDQGLDATAMSDSDLVCEVHRLVAAERRTTASLIAALAELDARRLYLGQGCSSLFTYCTQVLHLSEHAAYARIEAARAARKWPVLLELLAAGSLHLTAVTLLGRHLTDDNHLEVLRSARHKSKREIEELVARLHPEPPAPSSVQKLPSPRVTAAMDATSINRTIVPAECDDAATDPRGAEIPTAAAPNAAVDVPPFEPRAETKSLAPDRYRSSSPRRAKRTRSCARRRIFCVIRYRVAICRPSSIGHSRCCWPNCGRQGTRPLPVQGSGRHIQQPAVTFRRP